jgi:Domain of unknown function (DUF4129)
LLASRTAPRSDNTNEPVSESRRRPTGGEGSSARTLGVVSLALLALLALVAVASRGHRPLSGERAAREPSTAFWDYLFSVSVAVYLLAAIALVWVFAVRRRAVPGQATKANGRFVFFFLVAALLGVALADRLDELRRDEQAATRNPGQPTTIGRTSRTGAKPYEPEFKWLPVLLIGGAGAATAAYLAARGRVRRRAASVIADEELVEELVALLDDTLDDLRAEPDARRAVIAAYARMERALAAYGLRRRPFEAPLEYLDRIAPDLHDRQPSARRLVFELTHLFERAKFSSHAVDLEMKEDAIATLGALRDDLRSAAA